jgi:hypothetical protein
MQIPIRSQRLTLVRLSSQLAELDPGNSTFIDAANAALHFWQATLIDFSSVGGCMADRLNISVGTPSNDCGSVVNSSFTDENYDCTMWSAKGLASLSSVTSNSSMSAMCVHALKMTMHAPLISYQPIQPDRTLHEVSSNLQ